MNDQDSGIETNTGVEFPGLQVDLFAKQKIEDFQKTSNSFNSIEIMVVEVAASTADETKPRFLFKYDKSNPVMGKCENCYDEKVLKVKCPCGKANYCSQECRQKDENYHMRTCEYLNKVDVN